MYSIEKEAFYPDKYYITYNNKGEVYYTDKHGKTKNLRHLTLKQAQKYLIKLEKV